MALPSDYQTKLFINNEYVDAKSSDRLTLVNPWDESQLTTDVHVAGLEDVDYAVASARDAFKKGPWSKFSGAQRAAALHKFADLVEANADKLALVESLPTGRPISMIKGFDIPNLIATYRYYAGWADKIVGRTASEDNGIYKIVRNEPVGVCAGIASWNATLLYVGWKMAPALAAGCTFIFKASEKSPLGALAIADLFRQAGFPAGVANFVTGASQTGTLLASHPGINKISFTGSVNAGRAVQNAASKSNLKRVTLELGGKSAAIVFDDAHIENAVGNVGPGFLLNSGQICAAGSRLLVQESIAEKFIAALKSTFEQASAALGPNPLDPTTAYGPLVDTKQFERVMGYISIGKDSAQLVTGGARKGDKGCAIEPTIFLNPKAGSKIWEEEIFGPVLSIKTFKTEEEAVELANDTTYGLAASVYTSDITRALRISSALESGGVAVNTLLIPEPYVPFGGTKQSGIGRELGEEGLKAYLEPKTVYINLNVPPKA